MLILDNGQRSRGSDAVTYRSYLGSDRRTRGNLLIGSAGGELFRDYVSETKERGLRFRDIPPVPRNTCEKSRTKAYVTLII